MSFFKDKKPVVVETKENLIQTHEAPYFSELQFTDSKNVEYHCYMRKPHNYKGEKIPALILLGGMVTGKDVIKLIAEIEEINDVVIVSMEYPYTGKKKFKNALELLYHYPEIRTALDHSVWGVLHIIDYLYKHTWIDKEKVIVAGASFGAFFAVISGAIDERISAVITCYGGGDLSSLAAYNLPYKTEIINKVLGNLFSFLVVPFEPLKYVDKISPRPFLMVNGKEDEQIPRDSVTKLFEKAGEPKEIIWLETKQHIRPTQNALTIELTHIIAGWLKKNGFLE